MILVFDLDNTLINRNKAYYAWLKNLLYKQEIDEDTWQAIYNKDNWGYCSRLEFYSWIIKEFKLNEEVNFYINKCAAELHQFIEKDTLVLEMLKRLSLKFEIVIATNGSVQNQTNKLKASGILDFVKPKNIFISETLKLKKPAKEFFQIIENQFLKKSEFVMIGDDPINDIEGAKRLNWKTVWLSFDRKIELDSDFIIKDIFALEKKVIAHFFPFF